MSGSHPSDESLVWTLPLPLAQLRRRAENAKSALERHQAAYYLWEAALKLLGCTAVAEYLALGERDPEIDVRLRSLARPSLGHWWELARRLLPVLADAPATGARFRPVRDLLLGRARDDLPRAAGLDAALRETVEGAPGARTTVRLAELFERLVRYRNQELGHGAAGQRSRQFYERMGGALLAGVSEILSRLTVLGGGRLVHIADVRRQAAGPWLIERYELSGESARRLESVELAEADVSLTALLPRPGRVHVERPDQGAGPLERLRSLHPLVLYDPDPGEFLFLNARRGEGRAQYLSYATGAVVSREDLEADQRELFAAIAGEAVTAEAAREWSARSQAEEPPLPAAAAGTPRRTLGEFELLSKLGRGGMGIVYRAWQPSLGREVALKCVVAGGDPRIEARFAREIRSLGRVEHPHLVKVFTSGSDGDQWFYAMELIEGANLASVCDRLSGTTASEVGEVEWERAVSTAWADARRREEVLTPSPELAPAPAGVPPGPARGKTHRSALRPGRAHIEHSVELIRQTAQAAHALHEAGVIHRDIKPGNIVLAADGKHAVLMDLGLAQLADDAEGRLTRTRQFVGTLRYSSPEQVLAAGNLDRRADIYSLGATLWELLTLRPLFGAGEETPTPDLMLRIQSSEPERPRRWNPQVPPDLEAIVLKCLEKDRARRYETAAGLAEDLARWQRREPVEARAQTLGYVLGKYARRHRLKLAAAAAVLGLVLAGVIAAFIHIDRARDLAEEERAKAVLARTETETTLFDTYTSFGLEAGNGGKPAEALLWFANASFLAEDDAERQSSNRVRIRSWSRKVPVPVRALEHPGWDVRRAVFHPGGAHLLVLAAGSRCAVWDLVEEERMGWVGGDAPVSAAAFSPGGEWLATGHASGEVLVWGFPEGRKLHTLAGTGPVGSLAWSPDGRLLAFASDRARVWDSRDGRFATPELPHPKPIVHLVFSSRGNRLATACEDGKARVFALGGDPAGVEPLFPPVPSGRTTVTSRWLAPVFIDGDRGFLTLATTAEVSWWDAETGAAVRSMSYSGFVAGIVRSPDDRRFAVLWDNEAQVWDVAFERPLTPSFVHPGIALDAVFSPDATSLLTTCRDDATRVWLVPTRGRWAGRVEAGVEPAALIPGTFGVRRGAWSPEARHVATAEQQGLVRLFRLPEGPADGWRIAHGANHAFVSATSDGRYLVSTGATCAGCDYGRTTTRVHEAATGRVAGPIMSPGGVLKWTALAPAGGEAALLVTPNRGESQPPTLQMWDWRAGRRTREPLKLPSWPIGVAYGPDGKDLVVVCGRGEILAIDPSSGQVRLQLQAAGAYRYPGTFETMGLVRGTVDFSPDGKSFATWGLGNAVQVWETASGTPRIPPLLHPDVCTEASFSADGRLLLTVCSDNAARVWELARGVPAGPPLEHPTVINNACISSDGDLVLTGSSDRLARVWDWREGRLAAPPLEHQEPVTAVAFLSGGRRAATVSGEDTTVMTWELLTGRPLAPREPLVDEGGLIRQLVVGQDERWIVVAGEATVLTCISLGDLPEPAEPSMDPEDLRTFGEVLSGQRIHEAALATLTHEEWTGRWRSLGALRPRLFAFDPSRGEVAAWHGREAKRLEERLQWDAAAWHLGRLRALGKPVDEDRLRGLEAFVRSWRFAPVSEPWPRPHDDFVPMTDEKLRSIAASAAAQRLVRSSGPLVDFLFSFGGKNADVVGYAARTIASDRALAVRLQVGSDDARRVWLNGKLVMVRPGYHAAAPDNESALIQLAPGENTLVVEVSQAFGGWGLYLRLEDENGRKLRLTDDGKLEPLEAPAAAGR